MFSAYINEANRHIKAFIVSTGLETECKTTCRAVHTFNTIISRYVDKDICIRIRTIKNLHIILARGIDISVHIKQIPFRRRQHECSIAITKISIIITITSPIIANIDFRKPLFFCDFLRCYTFQRNKEIRIVYGGKVRNNSDFRKRHRKPDRIVLDFQF